MRLFRADAPGTSPEVRAGARTVLDASKLGGARLRYELPLDHAVFAQATRALRAPRTRATGRLGRDWTPGGAAVVRKRSEDDLWVAREDLRALDDACTRFVTKRLFPDAFARLNMVLNVVRMYDAIAAAHAQPYKIVFKGGVMMRLMVLELLHDLPPAVRHEAVAYVAKEQRAVGVSDFDFEIVPDDRGQDAGETYRQVCANSLYLLWLRRALEEDAGGLMDATWERAAGERELRDMLRAEVAALPRTHPLAGITVDHVHIVGADRTPPSLPHRTRGGRAVPAPRENLYIFRGTGADVRVASASDVLATLGVPSELVARLAPTRGSLYTTTNFHIGEDAPRVHPRSLRADFHLTRIKHAFHLYYTTPAGEKRIDRLAGEVVDLSQSHYGPNDERKAHMYHDQPHPWMAYPVVGVSDQRLRSYTPVALLHDVRDVLHHQDDPPWANAKVAKRLVRYCILLVLVVFARSEPRAVKVAALERLAAYVRDPARAARAPMEDTGVVPVDEFAEHEHVTLRDRGDGGARVVRDYYAAMERHLKRCVGFFAATEDGAGATPLNAAHVGYGSATAPRRRSTRC